MQSKATDRERLWRVEEIGHIRGLVLHWRRGGELLGDLSIAAGGDDLTGYVVTASVEQCFLSVALTGGGGGVGGGQVWPKQ